nr:flocculation protein FLO11-like [Lolium perenne]
MDQLMRETDICSDDIIRTFISRRVLPLQRRAHKISEMYGPGDPTKITGLPLSKEDAKQRFPRIAAEQRGPCRKRALDTVDPDPYVHWTDLKMGRTHTSRPDAPSASTNPQVLDHATPLQAEVGQEFLDKLASQGRKKKAPASEAGPSEAPPAKRPRQEVVGGKVVSKKNYRRREMPVASGAALKISKSASGIPPESSKEAARPSPPPQPSPGDNVSPPETQDTGASNTGANTEAAGTVEPPVPPAPKKKKKKDTSSSPSKTVPEPSAPATSTPAKDATEAPAPSKTAPAPPPAAPTSEPTAVKPTPPPSQDPATAKPKASDGIKFSKPKAAAVTSATSSGPQSLVLHAGRATVVAGETAPAPLGQITELTRGGAELGHLLDYAEKWNRADESPATRGLGKDKMPVVDPTGPRSTG